MATYFALHFKHEADNGSSASKNGGGDNGGGGSDSGKSAAWKALGEELKRNLDTTVKPCDDFYQYACGGWLERTTLLPSETKKSRSFGEIGDYVDDTLRNVTEANWPVIGPMYKSCMDEDGDIAKVGLGPLLNKLDQVDAVTTKEDLMGLVGALWAFQVELFFSTGPVTDSSDPSAQLWDLGQGGILLNTEDDYLGNNTDVNLPKYREHIATMFNMVNGSRYNATELAQNAVAVEAAIAAFTKPTDQMRDPFKTNNKYTKLELEGLSSLNWGKMCDEGGLPCDDHAFNLDNPSFVTNMTALITNTDLDELLDYARWQVVHASVDMLPTKFFNESFAFFDKFLDGAIEPEPRWKRCVAVIDTYLGDILGRYFVQEAFSDEANVVIHELVDTIKDTFGKNLPTVEWMDNDTRDAARDKLNLVVDRVGYPSKWTDYSSLHITPDAYWYNTEETRAFQHEQNVETLAKPTDRQKWQMTPPTVNAYYEPTDNTINFPAGILQAPYFKQGNPMAMQYGGIGMVMGHELGHGFDDQGRLYDGHGKLAPWSTEHSNQGFNERAQCLVNQYSAFEIDGHNVNGKQTLGENLGDACGITIGYRAYKAYVEKHGEEPRLVDDISNDQLFFLSFAQDWCTKIREKTAINNLKTDVHSPPRFRVKGPLQNLKEFADAFQCKAGDAMVSPDPCVVW